MATLQELCGIKFNEIDSTYVTPKGQVYDMKEGKSLDKDEVNSRVVMTKLVDAAKGAEIYPESVTSPDTTQKKRRASRKKKVEDQE
mgnify:CR=1 FL=1